MRMVVAAKARRAISSAPAISRLPSPAAQRRHFTLLLAALVLIGAALARAEPGPNPDYRPPLRTL